MLTKPIQDALNAQINLEFASAYSYLAMSAWFEGRNLPGSAAWMRRQAAEEVEHAMKIFDFVHDRDGTVTLTAVAKPTATWKDAEVVWASVLAHEEKVSASIHRLVDLAAKAKDHATGAMLQWFVTEQVEEEKTARGILEQVRLVKPTSSAMFFVDRHLGKDAAKDG